MATKWSEFADRYDAALDRKGAGYQRQWRAARRAVEQHLAPRDIDDIDRPALYRLQDALVDAGELKPASIDSYMRAIRAAIGWAEQHGEIAATVVAPKPLARPKAQGNRARAEDFDAVIAAAPTVRPNDSCRWVKFLSGLKTSGLRISEAQSLSWDVDAPIRLAAGGPSGHGRPMIYFAPGAQKNKSEQWHPVSPDFWRLVCDDQRDGLVFDLGFSQVWIREVLSRMCDEAGVSRKILPHDLRRTFISNMRDRGMNPTDLRLIARHKDLRTTMQYYLDEDAARLSDQIWE